MFLIECGQVNFSIVAPLLKLTGDCVSNSALSMDIRTFDSVCLAFEMALEMKAV